MVMDYRSTTQLNQPTIFMIIVRLYLLYKDDDTKSCLQFLYKNRKKTAVKEKENKKYLS